MKKWIILGLAIALVVNAALFVGIGYGSGGFALSAVSTSSNTAGDSCFTFSVQFVEPSNLPYYVANWVNGLSTPITFNIVLTVASTCNTYGFAEGWNGGVGSGQPDYTILTVAAGGTPEKINATANGGGVNYAVVSFNNSAFQSADCTLSGNCGLSGGNNGPGTHTLWTGTISLQGQYVDQSVITASFWGGSFASASASTLPGHFPQNIPVNPYNQAILRNGGAQFTQVPKTTFNGASFTVDLTTYYDAGRGFNVEFLYPIPRGSAQIAVTNVPDLQTNYPVTFTAPNNASVLSNSIANIQFQLVVYSPIAQVNYQTVYIDISPSYAPPAPTISWTDNQGNNPARVGDSGTVALAGAGNKTTGAISQFVIFAYFLGPALTPTGLPPPSSPYWISQGGQAGQTLTATVVGYNGTANYAISVSQAYDIEIQAISGSSQGQAAISFSTYLIQVLPPNCSPASGSCIGQTSLWQNVGPYLFVSMFVIASLLAAVFIPIPWLRIVLPVSVVVVVAVLLYFGLVQALFLPGSAFNAA